MRILLISPHFFPENFKCNDVAFELARRGHDVTVLSDIPNYPQGHFFKGYGIFRRRRETVQGVKVVRTLVVPRGDGSAMRLALNYASFALTATVRAFFMALFHRYDAVLVHETSPITVGIPGVLVSRMQRVPLYFWVLDLWPESLSAAGGVGNKYVLGGFARLTRWIYRHSRRILISSQGFRKSIEAKGDFADRIVYFPNWADRAFRMETGFRLPELPAGFRAMFAGNIGEAQDFEHLMEAALLLREEKRIHFVLVGDGRKRPQVERFVEEHGLRDTVHCLGRYPLETMPKFFAAADVMLVSLKDEPIFNLTAPAKLQAYMYASRPILAMLDGEGARIVKEAGCGAVVAAGDAGALAGELRRFSALRREELDRMGESGKRYYWRNFDFEKRIGALCALLEDGKDDRTVS